MTSAPAANRWARKVEMEMHKALIVKELSAEIVLRVRVDTGRGVATREIARFQKCGMGYVALGAAGRVILQGVGYVDEIRFDGHADTYKLLVTLGVIEEKLVAA